MTSIANALTSLGVKEWVLRGEPTTEAEFNSMFRKVTGADSNGTAIESSDPKDWGTTWKAVSDKKAALMASNWKTYRQALRDLPDGASPKLASDGTLDMSSVTFPTKPS
jgi:hypothetical protein